jgi:CheY-like chemotaxis protein
MVGSQTPTRNGLGKQRKDRVKIMIVDDHPGFRQIVLALLRDVGAEFLECGGGREAVEAYSRFRPDLVFMDIAMNNVDGLSATKQITKSFPYARVFILTQYDDPDLRQVAKQAGASGYLLKDDLSQLPGLIHD